MKKFKDLKFLFFFLYLYKSLEQETSSKQNYKSIVLREYKIHHDALTQTCPKCLLIDCHSSISVSPHFTIHQFLSRERIQKFSTKTSVEY